MRAAVRRLWGAAFGLLLGCGPAAQAPLTPPGVDAGASAATAASGSGESDAPSVHLEVGEALELRPLEGRVTVSLSPAPGEQYLLLLVSTSLETGRVFGYRSERLGVRAVSSSQRPMTGCSVTRENPVAAQPASLPVAAAPALGTKREWTLRLGHGRQRIQAEVRAVAAHTVVWADVSKERPAELEPAFVSAFLRDFESTVLPRARSIFGGESDVDGDGRIALLFTPRTRDAAVAYFSSCDLESECAGSNHAEVLYLTPPNAIDPPYNSPRAMKEILAHELEHLLHHQQKVLATPLERDRDSLYLLEGFGALAQDVTGLQAGNLYVTMAALEQVDRVSLGDLLQLERGYDHARDGALRGAAYLLVRWLYDRAGGDEVGADGSVIDRGGPTLLRRLLTAPKPVAEALAERVDVAQLAVELYTAWALPAGSSRNPCLSFAKPTRDPVTDRQRGADPFASFHGMQMKGAKAVTLEQADGQLRSGGVELFVIDSRADEPVSAHLSVDPAAEPRVVLLRRR